MLSRVGATVSYLGFHVLFTLPCIALLIIDARRRSQRWDRTLYQGIAIIIVLAVLYATPWDNWLVMEGIWTYAPNAVIATLGYVPVEEYLFFVLQPILTGLWLRSVLARRRGRWSDAKRPAVVWMGVTFWVILGVISGLLLLLAGSEWRYFAMIGIWVAPIIALQWAIGGAQLWSNRDIWALGILPPTLYLAAVDRVAIGAGVWHITEATSTGWFLFGLPIEEFLFFLFTNIMIVQGVYLFLWVLETGRLRVIYNHLRLPTIRHRPTISDRTHRTIQQIVIRPGFILLAVVTLAFLMPVQIPIEMQLAPLVLSAVMLGLPHGAVDHLVPGKMAGERLNRYQMATLLGGYLALLGLVLALWALSPVVGFVFFIALTWWHWGSADLHTTLTFHRAAFLNSEIARLLTVFVRGGLPMFVPLLFFPDDYRLALQSITTLFTTTDVSSLNGFFTNQFRLMAGIGFVTIVIMTLAITFSGTRQQDHRQQWMIYCGETVLLGLFFAIVPPFLAIGLYFCLWHSARHIARLIVIDQATSPDDLDVEQFGSDFLRFTKSATPLTLVSLVFLAALYVIIPTSPDNMLSLVALYLVLISALTLPHSVIVFWMDRVQGVWRINKLAKPRNYSVHIGASLRDF